MVYKLRWHIQKTLAHLSKNIHSYLGVGQIALFAEYTLFYTMGVAIDHQDSRSIF